MAMEPFDRLRASLVKKTNPSGTKTIYAAGGVYEVDKTSGGTVTRAVTYYPAGGAVRINITSTSWHK